MTAATKPGIEDSHRAHLHAELARLELVVRREVVRLRAANLIVDDDFRGLYIADEQIDALLAEGTDGTDRLSTLHALDGLIERARRGSDEAADRAPGEPPLRRVARIFGLSAFDTDVLLVALAPEVDLRWQTLYAYVQNDVTKKRPTVDFALKLLLPSVDSRLDARRSFVPEAPLLRHGLLRLVADAQEPDPPLIARAMKADDALVSSLVGLEGFACRYPGTRYVPEPAEIASLPLSTAARDALDAAVRILRSAPAAVSLQGPARADLERAAEGLASALGRRLVTCRLGSALADADDARTTLAAIRRDAALLDALLFVDDAELLATPEARARRLGEVVGEELGAFDGPLVLGGIQPWAAETTLRRGPVVSLEVPAPDASVRARLWREALTGGPVDLGSVADSFKLGAREIAHAASAAVLRAGLRDEAPTLADLHAAARAESTNALGAYAQKLSPAYTWDDIVLPPRALRSLREVCASMRFRSVVQDEWGFGRNNVRGNGLNALFSGASGTGKTMAAEIVANELGLDLYKIDLANVVSKYIGETEQNLSRIFAAADNAILFFDEADALFGKRSEVRDAHDRYANIEVAYLLQRIEEYEGVVVLATNLAKNVDDAFARRMHHAVEFPFPDKQLRERIWGGVFPPEAPLGRDVDLAFLAERFELAGGNIRNVAVAAATDAAQDGREIRMVHLVSATARELEKLGRLPSRAAFGRYYGVILEGRSA